MPRTLNFSSSTMSDTNDNVSLQQQTHEPKNLMLEPLFHALDPISLILNHNSHNSHTPFPLRLTTEDSFIMERGPRYKAYAELREKRLRMKCMKEQEEVQEEEPKVATPPRKQVKFQVGLGSVRKGSSSILARSVPDFTAALRKENRKPVDKMLNPIMEMTPPMKSGFSNKGNNGVLSGSRGSKSASAGEKKKGGGGVVLMARKSYASIDELKNLSSATANAINGEGKGGRNSSRVMGRTVSFSGYQRQF